MIDSSLHIAKIDQQRQLIKAHSDISDGLDEGSMAALLLLLSSIPFDITDHYTSMECAFGIEHDALSWMDSYFSNRIQHILIVSSK